MGARRITTLPEMPEPRPWSCVSFDTGRTRSHARPRQTTHGLGIEPAFLRGPQQFRSLHCSRTLGLLFAKIKVDARGRTSVCTSAATLDVVDRCNRWRKAVTS